MLTINSILAVVVPVGPVLLALVFVYVRSRRGGDEDIVYSVTFDDACTESEELPEGSDDVRWRRAYSRPSL